MGFSFKGQRDRFRDACINKVLTSGCFAAWFLVGKK